MTMLKLYHILYPWIDALWIPFALCIGERGKRLLTVGFILACIVLLRLQVELMGSMGLEYGFFDFMKSTAFDRGLVVYGVFIALFLFLAHFSKGGDKTVHMAASITILIMSFCVSTLIMVL